MAAYGIRLTGLEFLSATSSSVQLPDLELPVGGARCYLCSFVNLSIPAFGLWGIQANCGWKQSPSTAQLLYKKGLECFFKWFPYSIPSHVAGPSNWNLQPPPLAGGDLKSS